MASVAAASASTALCVKAPATATVALGGLRALPRAVRSGSRNAVRAAKAVSDGKERVSLKTATVSVQGLTAAATAAMLIVPEFAEAAAPGVSPSLRNFLLSIFWGGVVAALIAGAVTAVSFFDPIRRN